MENEELVTIPKKKVIELKQSVEEYRKLLNRLFEDLGQKKETTPLAFIPSKTFVDNDRKHDTETGLPK